MKTLSQEEFLRSINVNKDILEPLHCGIGIFDSNARLIYANIAYRNMYNLDDDNYIGLDAKTFFITANQGIMELLKTGKPNSCMSVSVSGLYGVTYRWPLRDNDGKLAGCMTENISVSSRKNRIGEIQDIIADLDSRKSYSKLISPGQLVEMATFDSLVGESATMRLLKEKARRFAAHEEPILILGEVGTGKDLVAQAIHAASKRNKGNFVVVNCAAIPAELMESEIFGYEQGAFNGARSLGKKGQFELASQGTLFLDEIAAIPLELQSKLLEVLETGMVEKPGSKKRLPFECRLLAATNHNLEQMVNQGTFNEDLYCRLKIFDLVIPPLRERLADLQPLAYAIIASLLSPERAASLRIDREVFSLCSAYSWRGNVRELRNVLTWAVYSMHEDETVLRLHHMPERFMHTISRYCEIPEFLQDPHAEENEQVQEKTESFANASLSGSKQEAERQLIMEALAQCGGNKVRTAKMLGIARSNLYRKLSTFGIDS